MKFNLTKLAATTAIVMLPLTAAAEEITLKLHQFLPPPATVPAKILKPWGEAIAAATDGQLTIQHHDAMSLGGAPPALYDQAKDGVADITMTLVGYTPGRFPSSEVLELPFMMTDAVSASKTFWQHVEGEWQETEFADVQVLGAWVHGPGVIHTVEPVEKLEDLEGLTVRGPTRVINDMLTELGAQPVGMPLPSIPQALSKGVIKGTVVPWEVTPSIRLSELVTNHTEFAGEESLYTATIILVMNKDKYNSLPDDLRAALDAESGEKLSAMAAEVMATQDEPGRNIAVGAGNNIITLDEAEVARWKAAAEPVYARWVAEMEERGIDGQALIDSTREMISANSQ